MEELPIFKLKQNIFLIDVPPGEPLIFLGSIAYGFGFGFDRIGRGIYVTLQQTFGAVVH